MHMGDEKTVQKFIRLTSHGTRTTGEPLAPPELRPMLVADVEAQGLNLKDVILTILAAKYRVPFEAKGRKTSPTAADSPVNLHIPMRLFQRVNAQAGANSRSVQKQIIADLCAHYGLRPVTPPRQARRGRRRTPSAA